MKTLFALLLLPFSLFATESLTLDRLENQSGSLHCILSDGFEWAFHEHLGGATIDQWELGDHLTYWHMPEYTNNEYRLINMDHFGCYKVYYIGRHS